MAILLLAGHDNRHLAAETAKALTAATALGGDVDILVAGADVGLIATAAAELAGVRKVLVACGEGLEHQLAEPLAALMHAQAADYDVFMAPATAAGKNVMPRLAALLGVMQLSDITEVVSADTFKRPTYAGNAIETVQTLDTKKVITVRAAAFGAAKAGGSATVVEIAPPHNPALSRFVAQCEADNDRPELGSARIVVAGGRGLGSAENFKALLAPLAGRLGAAIGASRAAVDAGYAANDLQVGQTGKVVSPELYIAIGISGAIQHLAGIRDSRVIVAINKDADAPIFQVADYGLVGDLFEIVPQLTKAL